MLPSSRSATPPVIAIETAVNPVPAGGDVWPQPTMLPS